jgi:uncharacterized protein YceH (UPF0502 family)
MNEGMDIPELEVVDDGEVVEEGVDLQGRINALETEIQALEGRYDETLNPRIEALKREKLKLQEVLDSIK